MSTKTTIMPEITEKFIPCECGSEGILVSKLITDLDKEIYLAIYSYGRYNKKPKLLSRLKYCWYHLTTGKKHDDQIILSFDRANKLGNWLIYNAKQEKPE